MTKTLIVRVTANVEEFDIDQAVVTLTAELKKKILDARELFQMVRSRDASLAELAFYDGTVDYAEGYNGVTRAACPDDEARADELAAVVWDSEVVPYDPEALGEFETVRTEVDLLHVTEEHFWWSASPKHDSTTMETPMMRYQTLEDL